MGKRLVSKEGLEEKKTVIEVIFTYYRELMDICISIYMLMVIVVIPFYYGDGYDKIATLKEHVFMGTVKLLLPLLAVEAVWAAAIFLVKKGSIRKKGKRLLGQLSVTDKFALCYGAAVLLSWLCTAYPEQALWGADSWYMGALPQLMLLGSYFQIAHAWEKKLWILFLLLPASFVQFVFGYLNRFGFYPIKMNWANPQFIGFVGNINWYCGYMVTILFGGVYLAWSGRIRKTWQKALLYCYLLAGFAGLVTNGSNSGILTLVGMLFLFFLLSVKERDRMASFCRIVLVLAAACMGTQLLRICFPGAMTYEEGMPGFLLDTALPAVLALLAASMLLWTYFCGRMGAYPEKLMTTAGKVIAVAAVALFGAGVLLIAGNTLIPGGIGKLSGNSFFTFSPEWGSKRGATWMGGICTFWEQGVWKKLIGVGPDCMGMYLFYDAGEGIKMILQEQFTGMMLTNAHNEWITVLANYGLLGLAGFAGMVVSAIYRFIRAGLKKASGLPWAWIAGACGACICAYTIHNSVSFQQVSNVTTMFLLLGAGENCLRTEE